MTAWEAYKRLPLRMKIGVAIAAPLWLPVAFVAWLDAADNKDSTESKDCHECGHPAHPPSRCRGGAVPSYVCGCEADNKDSA